MTTYTDIAARLDSSQSLTEKATLTLVWMPDKGDLIVHRVQLIRDGTVIDVLQGAEAARCARRRRSAPSIAARRWSATS